MITQKINSILDDQRQKIYQRHYLTTTDVKKENYISQYHWSKKFDCDLQFV